MKWTTELVEGTPETDDSLSNLWCFTDSSYQRPWKPQRSSEPELWQMAA